MPAPDRTREQSGKHQTFGRQPNSLGRNTMPISDEKKAETRERINRDPDFRDEFHTGARNMYVKAMKFDPTLADEIDRFEKILGSEPDTYEFEEGEDDEIDIFEKILTAFDNQVLLEEKEASTIN